MLTSIQPPTKPCVESLQPPAANPKKPTGITNRGHIFRSIIPPSFPGLSGSAKQPADKPSLPKGTKATGAEADKRENTKKQKIPAVAWGEFLRHNTFGWK